MRNKLIAVALGGMLALSAAPSLFAQDNTPPPQNDQGHRRMDPDAELQRMTSQLNLTPDQQSQIRPILVDRQQKMQALFQDDSLSQDDRRSKMMAIRKDSNDKIEAVLNDQQKQQFEAMQQRREHRTQGDNPQPQ